MDELIKQFERLGDLTNTFTFWDVSLVFLFSFFLSLAVGWTYRKTHRGVSYSQSFAHTLVMLGIIVSFVMLIIGSNLARAFTLVGALSIIRFRTAIKETKDIGFVFMVMAIGMACGTRFYLLAVFATVCLSGSIIVMSRFNFFAKEIRERLLVVQLPPGSDHEKVLAEVFRRQLDEYYPISVETVREGEAQEVIYSVVLKRRVEPARLLEEIRSVNDNHKVSLVLGQQEIDL